MGNEGGDRRNWLTRKIGLKDGKSTSLSLDTASKVNLYKEDASMNWKPLMKYSFVSALLVVFALCLLLPLQKIDAGSPEPTPGTRMNIINRLQPGWTSIAEANQFDGRLFEEAPSPPEVEESPVSTEDQQTLYAIADATVLEGYPAVNFGDATDMWAGYDDYLDPYGEIARSLVKFDIASLPHNQVITKATLRVYLVTSRDYPDTSRSIRTYRITSNWSENNVNWNNKPGYGSAYGSRSIVHEAWGWYEFDVTELVTAWYDGTYSNHGIMLRGPEISGVDSSWRGFGTRENSSEPQLVIDFTASASTSTATQEPTPTQTPTPIVTANTNYSPMLLKYAASAPTPTASPPGQPMSGVWSGTTNQDYPVNFTVASSRTSLSQYNIKYQVSCEGGSLTREGSIEGDWPITDSNFNISDSFLGHVFEGTFTSTTSAHGTWSASFDSFAGHCSGSGTWTTAWQSVGNIILP